MGFPSEYNCPSTAVNPTFDVGAGLGGGGGGGGGGGVGGLDGGRPGPGFGCVGRLGAGLGGDSGSAGSAGLDGADGDFGASVCVLGTQASKGSEVNNTDVKVNERI